MKKFLILFICLLLMLTSCKARTVSSSDEEILLPSTESGEFRVSVFVSEHVDGYEEGAYLIAGDDAKTLDTLLKSKSFTENWIASDGTIELSSANWGFALYIGDDSCHINCEEGGIRLSPDDEIVTIVKKYLKVKQKDENADKDAVKVQVNANSIGYRSGTHTITGDDAKKLKSALESKSYTGRWDGYGPAISIQIYVGDKEYWLQVCVNEVRFRISTTEYKTLEIDKDDEIVKIIEKYIAEIQTLPDEIIIEKINAKGSFANEYRVPGGEARRLLALLDTAEKTDYCICTPTHRVYCGDKVYNVSIGDYAGSHFSVDGKMHYFNYGEFNNIYEVFQKFVSKDYFVATKKIDTEYRCEGKVEIKVKAYIKDYLKEIGGLWPSSPETIEFTVTGSDAQALYKKIRLNTFAKNKANYKENIELEVDGHTFWLNTSDAPYIVSAACKKSNLEKDDEILKLYDNCFKKALKEQGLDKETLTKGKNLVAYENSLERYSDCGAPCAFYFDSVDEAVRAIKTHEYTMGADERESMEEFCSRIIDEKDRLDTLSKIGTKGDFRFDSYKTDNIKYFYKVKDSVLGKFKLDYMSVNSTRINYSYKLNSNSNLAKDSKISVTYLRPDAFAFETDSYFDDYVEYYGQDVLSDDGFVFKDRDTTDRYATIMFAAGNSIIEITGYGDMADYKELKKLCVAQKVDIK